MLWHPQPSKECWDYNTNGRIYCTYVHIKSGYRETITCNVADALKQYYGGNSAVPVSPEVAAAINTIEQNTV